MKATYGIKKLFLLLGLTPFGMLIPPATGFMYGNMPDYEGTKLMLYERISSLPDVMNGMKSAPPQTCTLLTIEDLAGG
jgi:hypothetical protein